MNMKFNAVFWKWFGDSFVVDSRREPLVVYHGTDKKFNEFKNKGGSIATFLGDEKVKRSGFFFTPKRAAAKLFAGKNGYVMKCYLSIQKPADFTITDLRIDNALEKQGINLRWLNDTGDMWEKFDGDDGETFVAALQRAGYDGAIINEYMVEMNGNVKVYIAFNPAQIKSAENNDGTWDSDDPDIRSNPPLSKLEVEAAKILKRLK